MRITFRNLGPLREATVDLSSKLSLFVGPNNTGKTYLAYATYAAYVARTPSLQRVVSTVVADAISRWEPVLLERLARHWPDAMSAWASDIRDSLPACFAASDAEFGETTVVCESAFDEAIRSVPGQFATLSATSPTRLWTLIYRTGDQIQYRIVDASNNPGRVTDYFNWIFNSGTSEPAPAFIDPSALADDARVAVVDAVANAVTWSIARGAASRATFFPAERVAVALFAKELAAARADLVDVVLEQEHGPTTVPPAQRLRDGARAYPWPIRDALREARSLAPTGRREGPLADLAAELESTILGGSVGVSDAGETEFHLPSRPTKPLPTHLAGSMVKSLSGLVFHLRHSAYPGELLMIDEPEINLHPDTQRKLALFIGRLLGRGVRVLISTHSDYIIREVNHLVMLSRGTPQMVRAAAEVGYAGVTPIEPGDVRVYAFREGHVSVVAVAPHGFGVDSIDRELARISSVSQTLYMALAPSEDDGV